MGETGDPITRLAIAEERIRQLMTLVEAFGPTARQVLEATAQLEVQANMIAETRRDLEQTETMLERAVERVEKSCSKLADQLAARDRADEDTADKRRTARATIIVGCLGAASTLGAIVIGHFLG